MADPGRFQYVLDGKAVGFINSDDNKIIIRSDAPTVEIDLSGVTYPTTGSLSLSGKTPKRIGFAAPGTASLSLAGTVPVFAQPITVSLGTLAFSGKVPTLGASALPTTASITITEQTVERMTGLKLDAFAPTTVVAEVELPLVGSLSFASEKPDVSSSSATQITKVPKKKSVVLSGKAPLAAVSNVTLPTTDTLTIQGRLTNIYPVEFPSTGAAAMTGYVPDVIGEGQVGVIIEGPFEYGTFIRNTTATTDVPVNYQIDDRTGFKIKIKDPFVQDYTGAYTRPESADKRSEQEFLRSKSEHYKGPQRPEPVGDETYVEDLYPNGVSADDL